MPIALRGGGPISVELFGPSKRAHIGTNSRRTCRVSMGSCPGSGWVTPEGAEACLDSHVSRFLTPLRVVDHSGCGCRVTVAMGQQHSYFTRSTVPAKCGLAGLPTFGATASQHRLRGCGGSDEPSPIHQLRGPARPPSTRSARDAGSVALIEAEWQRYSFIRRFGRARCGCTCAVWE